MNVANRKRLLVVDVAGLGCDLLQTRGVTALDGHTFQSTQAVFPAVTCSAQASLRTGAPPSVHGVAANGFFDRSLRRTFFWEQSAALVGGPRIWAGFRARGGTVAMLFWQQSLGEDVDQVLSPAPVHKHHGGMIESVYSQPADLHARVRATVGRDFALRHYWGPMASARSSQWIADATCAVMAQGGAAPALCLTYLPGLDYDLQRHGPSSAAAAGALKAVLAQLTQLLRAARDCGYEVLAFGDYAIAACPGGPVFPNRALAAAGLLATRRIDGMQALDLHAARAFALVDHEIAHVYTREARDADAARKVLSGLDGVAELLDIGAQSRAGVAHARGGELLAVAAPGRWLAYPWWTGRRAAPEYAAHVDIHQKPGFDPCELFWGWPPGTVSRDPGRIRGTHGRTGPGREVACLSTVPGLAAPTLPELGRRIGQWLEATA